ncbi:hypothetical protein SNEBB_005379 [Seison nebaliae]|nr:hypothetical protein SNEBB_005379 [Seison nebaliae]
MTNINNNHLDSSKFRSPLTEKHYFPNVSTLKNMMKVETLLKQHRILFSIKKGYQDSAYSSFQISERKYIYVHFTQGNRTRFRRSMGGPPVHKSKESLKNMYRNCGNISYRYSTYHDRIIECARQQFEKSKFNHIKTLLKGLQEEKRLCKKKKDQVPIKSQFDCLESKEKVANIDIYTRLMQMRKFETKYQLQQIEKNYEGNTSKIAKALKVVPIYLLTADEHSTNYICQSTKFNGKMVLLRINRHSSTLVSTAQLKCCMADIYSRTISAIQRLHMKMFIDRKRFKYRGVQFVQQIIDHAYVTNRSYENLTYSMTTSPAIFCQDLEKFLQYRRSRLPKRLKEVMRDNQITELLSIKKYLDRCKTTPFCERIARKRSKEQFNALDYCNCGQLATEDVKFLTAQIFLGIQYLINILYSDNYEIQINISTSNILINVNGRILLTDTSHHHLMINDESIMKFHLTEGPEDLQLNKQDRLLMINIANYIQSVKTCDMDEKDPVRQWDKRLGLSVNFEKLYYLKWKHFNKNAHVKRSKEKYCLKTSTEQKRELLEERKRFTWWQFGCVFFELLYLEKPTFLFSEQTFLLSLCNHSQQQLLRKLLSNGYDNNIILPNTNIHCEMNELRFLKNILTGQSSTQKEIKKHPYFKDMKWSIFNSTDFPVNNHLEKELALYQQNIVSNLEKQIRMLQRSYELPKPNDTFDNTLSVILSKLSVSLNVSDRGFQSTSFSSIPSIEFPSNKMNKYELNKIYANAKIGRWPLVLYKWPDEYERHLDKKKSSVSKLKDDTQYDATDVCSYHVPSQPLISTSQFPSQFEPSASGNLDSSPDSFANYHLKLHFYQDDTQTNFITDNLNLCP